MKRFLRFRLSTLFLLLLLSALLLKGHQWWTREARAIEKLEKQGANFHFFAGGGLVPGNDSRGYEYCHVEVGPDTDLSPIADLSSIRNLKGAKRAWTSRDAQTLSRCPSLRWLSADGARGARELLAGTQHLRNLRVLHLRDSDVSSADLALLNPTLEQLDLGNCKIDDAGVASIGQLTRLIYLDLDKCHATDDGLAALQSCKDLQYLSLQGAQQVGDGAFATFVALPKLTKLLLISDRLTDAGLRRIVGSRSLKDVHVFGKGVDHETSLEIQEHFRGGVPSRTEPHPIDQP